MIYLDSAATTAVRREVIEAMWPYLTGEFGNPSSHHGLGASASRALEQARSRVAEFAGARASEVTFTSGGTESDNLAIKGIALATPRGRHLVTSAVEHPAVLESCDYLRRHHGFDVTTVAVDAEGLIDPDEFASAIRHDTTLCSIMYANNEVGAVQPIATLASIAREGGTLFHTDAVQAAGSLELDIDTLGVDAVSISGHKLGAPKGIGALVARGRVGIEPVLSGGGQERGRRSGTPNVAGAVGLAVALELAQSRSTSARERLTVIRDGFIDEVLATVPGARLTGPRQPRLPESASFCFPGTSGESILVELEARGILCSSGSACAAGSDDPSPVLLAMGIPAQIAQTAVRFTLATDTTVEDLSRVAGELRVAVRGARSLG